MAATSGGKMQDRRGFKFYINLGFVLVIVGCFLIIFSSNTMAVEAILVGVGLLTFFTAERISRPPTNNPSDFIRFFQHGTCGERRPVLVCIGDSLTHGRCSSDYTREIVPKLSAKLKIDLPTRSRETFEKPVWVINAGQNYLTSWGMLNERLAPVMDCYPDYVILFVGADEIRSLHGGERKKKALMKLWKNGSQRIEISMDNFEKNLCESIDYILQASPMTLIGIMSLPPIGENLTHPVNRLVKQANSIIYNVAGAYDDRRVSVIPLYDKIEDRLMSKPKRWNNIPIEFSSFLFPVLNIPLLNFLGVSNNWISNIFSHDLYVDGYHFNERGSNIVADYIVQWLVDRNVQKAIAVKSF